MDENYSGSHELHKTTPENNRGTEDGSRSAIAVALTPSFLEPVGRNEFVVKCGRVTYADHFYQRGALMLTNTIPFSEQMSTAFRDFAARESQAPECLIGLAASATPEAMQAETDRLKELAERVNRDEKANNQAKAVPPDFPTSPTFTLEPRGSAFGRQYALMSESRKSKEGNHMFVAGLVPHALLPQLNGELDFEHASVCLLLGFELDYTRSKWRVYIVHPRPNELLRDITGCEAPRSTADGGGDLDGEAGLGLDAKTRKDSGASTETDSEDERSWGEDARYYGRKTAARSRYNQYYFWWNGDDEDSEDVDGKTCEKDSRAPGTPSPRPGPAKTRVHYHPQYENQDVSLACWLPISAAPLFNTETGAALHLQTAICWSASLGTEGRCTRMAPSSIAHSSCGRHIGREREGGDASEWLDPENRPFWTAKWLLTHGKLVKEVGKNVQQRMCFSDPAVQDLFRKACEEDGGVFFDEHLGFGKKRPLCCKEPDDQHQDHAKENVGDLGFDARAKRMWKRLKRVMRKTVGTGEGTVDRETAQKPPPGIAIQVNERIEAVFDPARWEGKSLDDYRWTVLTPSCPTQFRVHCA
ncbi:unnamed protein product [Amoebophrya sp. A120]|nr:unnamed protein product [Amoebophrya sp. A120]|eukprot:GSA120T00005734001.1